MDLNDLLRAREAKRAAANTLASKAGATAEDIAQVEGMIAEVEGMDRQIAAIRKTQGEASARVPTDQTQEQLANRGRHFATAGEQLVAIARASGINPQVDRRLHAVNAAATGLSEGVPVDGGFLLEPTLVADLIQRTYEGGQMINRARRFGVGPNSNSISLPYIDESSRADGSRWGAVRGYWEAEADATTASKPKFGREEIKLQKLMALCYATEELLQDAVALDAVVNQVFPDELRFKLQDAVVRGDGVGKPLGILNSGALVSVAKETGQAADTVLAENIMKMWSRLYAPCRGNAVWFINQDVEPQLYGLSIAVGTGGVPVYMPANGLAGLPYGTLFGRPVVAIEHADTVGDQGDIILADMSQYALVDKGGIQTASSVHVQFLYAETVFRFIYRVNGQPLWKTYLTPFQSANTLSPFVVLDARA